MKDYKLNKESRIMSMHNLPYIYKTGSYSMETDSNSRALCSVPSVVWGSPQRNTSWDTIDWISGLLVYERNDWFMNTIEWRRIPQKIPKQRQRPQQIEPWIPCPLRGSGITKPLEQWFRCDRVGTTCNLRSYSNTRFCRKYSWGQRWLSFFSGPWLFWY